MGAAEPAPPRKHVARHVARKRALDVLYEADLKDRPVPAVLAAHMADEDPLPEYSATLVRGVHRHRAQLDDLISSHAKDWSLARMPVIDRNLLRLGLFELLHAEDVPPAVAINEAVELAKELSTDDSPRFVNGLLARVADEQPDPT
jgi:transcription antitermination protein NusB